MKGQKWAKGWLLASGSVWKVHRPTLPSVCNMAIQPGGTKNGSAIIDPYFLDGDITGVTWMDLSPSGRRSGQSGSWTDVRAFSSLVGACCATNLIQQDDVESKPDERTTVRSWNGLTVRRVDRRVL
jgi:hypothetical protein